MQHRTGAVSGDFHVVLGQWDAALALFRPGESLRFIEEFRWNGVVNRWFIGLGILMFAAVSPLLPPYSIEWQFVSFFAFVVWIRLMVYGGSRGTRVFVSDQRVMLERGNHGLLPESIEFDSIRDIDVARTSRGTRFGFADLIVQTDVGSVMIAAVHHADAVLEAIEAGINEKRLGTPFVDGEVVVPSAEQAHPADGASVTLRSEAHGRG